MSFRSSKGRDVGKEVTTWQSSNIGQGIGGGAGAGAPVAVSATGGTKTIFTNTGYTIHEFKTPGTFSIDSGEGQINLVLVAGGQGGAPNRGGGGGAGGLLHRCHINVDPTTSPFAVVIGAGGGADSNGANSTFGPTFTAYGGASGRGGDGPGGIGQRGGAVVPAPLLPQGNSGGPGSDPKGGGGGGAGSGGHPSGNGRGGDGIYIPTLPAAYGDGGFFAGGGGGGNHSSAWGGSGGGGSGPTGGNGGTNTGGGGGGGPDGGNTGSGGPGICIVYYLTN
tara:strand:+ start:490 stop:1323 length:834 start_codon:yes stop_codon:yes gene_type:complete